MSYVRRHYNTATVTTTLYQWRQMHVPADPLLGVRTLQLMIALSFYLLKISFSPTKVTRQVLLHLSQNTWKKTVTQQLFQQQSVFILLKHLVKAVADDTDIAIMPLYHWNGEMSDIIFNSKKSEATWSKVVSACSNLEGKEHLLFVRSCLVWLRHSVFNIWEVWWAKESFRINQWYLGR